MLTLGNIPKERFKIIKERGKKECFLQQLAIWPKESYGIDPNSEGIFMIESSQQVFLC